MSRPVLLPEYLGGCSEPYTVSATAVRYDAGGRDAVVLLYARDETLQKSVHVNLTPADARGLAVRLLLAADGAEALDQAAHEPLSDYVARKGFLSAGGNRR